MMEFRTFIYLRFTDAVLKKLCIIYIFNSRVFFLRSWYSTNNILSFQTWAQLHLLQNIFTIKKYDIIKRNETFKYVIRQNTFSACISQRKPRSWHVFPVCNFIRCKIYFIYLLSGKNKVYKAFPSKWSHLDRKGQLNWISEQQMMDNLPSYTEHRNKELLCR